MTKWGFSLGTLLRLTGDPEFFKLSVGVSVSVVCLSRDELLTRPGCPLPFAI